MFDNIKIDLEKYSVYNVLESGIDLQTMILLDYIYQCIKTGKVNTQKDVKGYTHYIINTSNYCKNSREITTSSDNMLRKLKNLADKGYLSILMGRFNDPYFGYTRTAFKLNKKFTNLLK